MKGTDQVLVVSCVQEMLNGRAQDQDTIEKVIGLLPVPNPNRARALTVDYAAVPRNQIVHIDEILKRYVKSKLHRIVAHTIRLLFSTMNVAMVKEHIKELGQLVHLDWNAYGNVHPDIQVRNAFFYMAVEFMWSFAEGLFAFGAAGEMEEVFPRVFLSMQRNAYLTLFPRNLSADERRRMPRHQHYEPIDPTSSKLGAFRADIEKITIDFTAPDNPEKEINTFEKVQYRRMEQLWKEMKSALSFVTTRLHYFETNRHPISQDRIPNERLAEEFRSDFNELLARVTRTHQIVKNIVVAVQQLTSKRGTSSAIDAYLGRNQLTQVPEPFLEELRKNMEAYEGHL